MSGATISRLESGAAGLHETRRIVLTDRIAVDKIPDTNSFTVHQIIDHPAEMNIPGPAVHDYSWQRFRTDMQDSLLHYRFALLPDTHHNMTGQDRRRINVIAVRIAGSLRLLHLSETDRQKRMSLPASADEPPRLRKARPYPASY